VSIDADYFGVLRPIVPVYQAWRENGVASVVTIGTGGHLVLKFNHRVGDDENNLYGIDFIVFGNAMVLGDGVSEWQYGDPYSFFLPSGLVNTEFGKVSVSQDGITWYGFEEGPFADSFAPALGRILDPNEPNDSYPGWNNLWWSELTDPTVPLDPNIEAGDFAGSNLAELCMAYSESAGGTGFDLQRLASEHYEELSVDEETGRRWIQYVKVECLNNEPDNDYRPEVDAVSDVGCCGDYKRPFMAGDISRDCSVDFEDLEILGWFWLCEIVEPDEEAARADIYKDGEVNFLDFAVLAEEWGENI